MNANRVPRPALALGAAGLVPPLAGLWAMALAGDPVQVAAVFMMIFTYATLIFSFVGGIWWGFASRAGGGGPGWGELLLAVCPSLAAFLSFVLLGVGGIAGVFVLAALILMSPFVDLRFVRRGLAPDWWMRLRVPLSAGLAALLGGAALLVP